MVDWTRPSDSAGGDPDKPGKQELVGALIVIDAIEFDPEYETAAYGTRPMAEFDLLVVDGPHAGYIEKGRREFGVLGRQIGAGLKPGQRGLGRIESGQAKGGKSWFGIAWAEDEEDFQAAEAALAPRIQKPRDVRKATRASGGRTLAASPSVSDLMDEAGF